MLFVIPEKTSWDSIRTSLWLGTWQKSPPPVPTKEEQTGRRQQPQAPVAGLCIYNMFEGTS